MNTKMSGVLCPICNQEMTVVEADKLFRELMSWKCKGKVSPKKIATAQANGKKGGRPRKMKE